MNKRIAGIILTLIASMAFAGCGTTGMAGQVAGEPILSAADARAMISVEVRELEPLPVDEAVAAR